MKVHNNNINMPSLRWIGMMMVCFMMCLPVSVLSLKQLFVTPGLAAVVCTDSADNVCTAPTACASLGSTNFSAGNSLNVKPVTQADGIYTIQGGYSIEFPSNCNITCTGNCTCKDCTAVIVIQTSDATITTKTTMGLVLLLSTASTLVSWWL